MRAFEWPGNVRQFLNVLKRVAYLERPVAELPEEERQTRDKNAAVDLPKVLNVYCPDSLEDVATVQEVYSAYLQHVLDLFEGNITQTAKAVGIAPNTLRKYLAEPN